jgi:hypothetical protein
MLVAIVGINSPAGSTYDVEVKITVETTVKEGSVAIFPASITNIITRVLENKDVLRVDGVLYHVG